MTDPKLDRLMSLRQLRERQAAAALARQTRAAKEAARRANDAQRDYQRFLDELEAEDASTLQYLKGDRLDFDALQQEHARRFNVASEEAGHQQTIEQARTAQDDAETQRDALAGTHSHQRKRREAMDLHRQIQANKARLDADLRDEDEAERLTRPD
jgi:multidrug resistance efflux pump